MSEPRRGAPGRAARALARLAAVVAVLAGGALGAAGSGAPAGASAPDPGPAGTIGHVGRWLTDAQGRVVLFHGVNMVEKAAPYYPAAHGFSAADAAWLEANGLQVVRLGVLATGLMPTPDHIDHAYLAHLAATVDTLERHHIYVLLDLHQDGWGPTIGSDGFPGWMTLTDGATNNHAPFPSGYADNPAVAAAFQSLWDNRVGPGGTGLQTDVAAMFGALAATFGHTPTVVGYDAFNEPWPGTDSEPCLAMAQGCPTVEHADLDPLYARIDRAIRTTDRSHLLFTEPFLEFDIGETPTFVGRPDGDAKSGLSFHLYGPVATLAEHDLDYAQAWSKQTGGALLSTEWGATDNTATIETNAARFDQSLVPWIFWSFDTDVVRHLGAAPTGSNLVESTVAGLVRPHLFVVAGTPTALAYTPGTHTMTAGWSTTEPDGHRAPEGSISVVDVPTTDEPHGYHVTLSGARVTSAPCASTLTVETDQGAKAVRLSLSPGSCRAPSG